MTKGLFKQKSNSDEPRTEECGNGFAAPSRPLYSDRRLRLNPNTQHTPECYDDLKLEFTASLFSSLERHLPTSMLGASRDVKLSFMQDILSRYFPEGERTRVQKHQEYREKIMSNYMPLNKELYSVDAASFFVSSFIQAVSENTEESFRSVISEPCPGVLTFQMFQSRFCELLLSEIAHFEEWVRKSGFRIMRPNTMNKYGAVLDDFGLEPMLDKLMDEFICPISKFFFSDVGGSSLDSHHGFVVEYGQNKDVELGFHVDDSEVTLNVCLGKQFSGGELFFRGTRCDKHVNSDARPEEILDYSHVPGQAVLHRGRHRHGAKPTTSGYRINLLLWCRSSVFRELKRHQKDFSSWCGECHREKKKRQKELFAVSKLELVKADESIMR